MNSRNRGGRGQGIQEHCVHVRLNYAFSSMFFTFIDSNGFLHILIGVRLLGTYLLSRRVNMAFFRCLLFVFVYHMQRHVNRKESNEEKEVSWVV